jgi:hypothetical protein
MPRLALDKKMADGMLEEGSALGISRRLVKSKLGGQRSNFMS